MGLDLTVAPMRYHTMNWWLAFDRLRLDCDYDLFSQIGPCSRGRYKPITLPLPLPAGTKFDWYEDESVKTKTEDPYGVPLTYLPAAAFRDMILEGVSDWNKAVLVFLAALPPDTPVVLWWN